MAFLSNPQINHNTIAQWPHDERYFEDSVIFPVVNNSVSRFLLDKVGSLNIRDKILWHNGLTGHRSTDFEGDRWSVVASTSSAKRCRDFRQRDELRPPGFRLPPPVAHPSWSSPLAWEEAASQEGELYVGRSRRWGDGLGGNVYRVHCMDGRRAVIEAYGKVLRLEDAARCPSCSEAGYFSCSRNTEVTVARFRRRSKLDSRGLSTRWPLERGMVRTLAWLRCVQLRRLTTRSASYTKAFMRCR